MRDLQEWEQLTKFNVSTDLEGCVALLDDGTSFIIERVEYHHSRTVPEVFLRMPGFHTAQYAPLEDIKVRQSDLEDADHKMLIRQDAWSQ